MPYTARYLARLTLLVWLAHVGLAPTVLAQEEIPESSVLHQRFTETIRPLFQSYCMKCHDQKNAKDRVRLDSLDDRITAQNIHVWNDVKNVLDVGAMPPKKEQHRPTREEQERLLIWIGGSIKRYDADHLETGGDTLVRRINKRSYANMIQTLLGIPAQGLDEFPEDLKVEGFDTVGSGLYMDTRLYQLYAQCARKSLDLAIRTEPTPPKVQVYPPPGPPPGKISSNTGICEQAIECLQHHPDQYMDRVGMLMGAWGIADFIDEMVKQHYKKKNMAEVKAAGIDWLKDPECRAKAVDIIKKELEEENAVVRNMDSLQWNDQAGLQTIVKVPGYYKITGQMCVSNAKYPMPVFIDGQTGEARRRIRDAVMVCEPRSAPKKFEMTVFLEKGPISLGFHVIDRLENFAYLHAVYGLPWPADYRRGSDDFDVIPMYGRPVFLNDGTQTTLTHRYKTKTDRWKAYEPVRVMVQQGGYHIQGPLYDTWPPPATSRIFSHGLEAKPTRQYADEIVTAFMKRAYAGVCDPGIAKPYVDLVMAEYEGSKDFVQGVKFGLAAILCSPRFLYLDENQRTDAFKRKPLSAHELARRLAYFLWSDLPDDALLDSASSGALLNDKELAAQTRRLLKDGRSRAFREAFTTQWLKIEKLGLVPVPPDLFPTYDDVLLKSAKEESVAFLSELLDKNLSIANFIDSDFAMLNSRLAAHYGIPGVVGDEFRRVPLPASAHRGGVLTQAAVLQTYANGMVSSVVRRGAFIMERLLGVAPGVPPPNVPALDTVSAKPGGVPFTQRERLSAHRENMSCARCHDKIDPLGAGLENFNAIGAWNQNLKELRSDHRAWEELPADVHGTMPDGKPYNGVDELKHRLMEHKDRFARAFTECLLIYALGRRLELSDQPVLDRICGQLKEKGYGLATLVEQVVISDLFRDK